MRTTKGTITRAHAEPWTLGGAVITWTAFSASVFTNEISIVVSIGLGLTGIAATTMAFIVGRKKARGLDLDNQIKLEQLEKMKRWREDE